MKFLNILNENNPRTMHVYYTYETEYLYKCQNYRNKSIKESDEPSLFLYYGT